MRAVPIARERLNSVSNHAGCDEVGRHAEWRFVSTVGSDVPRLVKTDTANKPGPPTRSTARRPRCAGLYARSGGGGAQIVDQLFQFVQPLIEGLHGILIRAGPAIPLRYRLVERADR
jgi:hypothetical protein